MNALGTTDRGDLRGFLWSLVFVAVVIWFLLTLYWGLNQILIELWGSRSGLYLDTYRPWGAKVWRLFYRSSSSWLFLWLPALWLFSTFLIQSVLRTNSAKAFNKIHILFIVAFAALAFFSVFSLLVMTLTTIS